ncbi:MAG: hypothetical protein J6Q82_07595 [Clostridia bacterium]|nr:hypothetical protein [Clostridia bacterium]
MSYQSQMEEYRKEYRCRRNKMLLVLKITVIVLAATILITAGVLGVMLATDSFSSTDYEDDGGDGGGDRGVASITGPEGDFVILYMGDAGVSYKSFVKTTGAGELQIDASAVNLKAVGTYKVQYSKGSITYTLTVYVRQKPFSEADRTKLYGDIAAKAGELGITSNLSKAEQIEKVYDFVNNYIHWGTDRSNIASSHGSSYTRATWQTDWEEEAALALASGEGDCYSYYSLSKVFFEYLGIKNQGIQRSAAANEPGTHFWSIVEISDGVWYYYDATRLAGSFSDGTKRGCLMTEAKLFSYVTSKGGKEFYKFDKWEGFPTIATQNIG